MDARLGPWGGGDGAGGGLEAMRSGPVSLGRLSSSSSVGSAAPPSAGGAARGTAAALGGGRAQARKWAMIGAGVYVATGDARDPESARRQDILAGKILRVTRDGAAPADNPRPGELPFVTGIRNAEGFDWLDDETLVVTDHGPSGELGRSGHDEVSVAKAGADLGWSTIYGCQSGAGMVTPSLAWKDAVPPGGAAIYRGDRIPEWEGSLLIGTLRSKHLHRVVFDARDKRRVTKHEVYFRERHGRLRDVVMGPDGELYVTTSNCDGRGECPSDKDRILRITR